jgi:RND family efflux transporter MFP subunit
MIRSRIYANSVGNQADLGRVNQQRANYVTNLKLAESYLNQMKIAAPADGVVNILTNFRSQGTFGRAGAPPFKEGDNVWTVAQIMEIPDISQMYIELKLDEVDRGKIVLGQEVKIHVDSIPEKEFLATLDFISPAASLVFSGVGANAQQSTEKNFPAQATLKKLDDRLRPGTSASAEIIVERQPNTLTIPLQANFDRNGKPIVYVQSGGKFVAREIQIGKRNESEVLVTGGLQEGEIIATQDPIKLARQTKKKM